MTARRPRLAAALAVALTCHDPALAQDPGPAPTPADRDATPTGAPKDGAGSRHRPPPAGPSVDRVVAAAIEAHEASLAELDALSDRARLRGVVPTLELSARRGQNVDLYQNQSLATGGVRLSTDDALTLQASLRFDLPRLLFAREEVALTRERRRRREMRTAVVEEVTTLYFERRRLQFRILQHPEDEVLKLRIEEIEARLNAFTAGRFRQMINKDAKSTGTPALRGGRGGRDHGPR